VALVGLFCGVDILILDGKVAGIVVTMDATRRIGRDAEPLLAVHSPSTDGTELLLTPHNGGLLKRLFPYTF